MKRIALFLGTNLAIIVVASITLSLLGVNSFLNQSGTNLDLQALLIFCFIFGMAGSVISLLLSKKIAKTPVRLQIIVNARNTAAECLFNTTERPATESGWRLPGVRCASARTS